MTEATGVCPLSREQIVAQYFLEHRARLLDIAAFLDRLDRAAGGGVPDFASRRYCRPCGWWRTVVRSVRRGC
ncbi:MAG: hypothetical protein ACK5A1_22570 [Planctomyces sp.]